MMDSNKRHTCVWLENVPTAPVGRSCGKPGRHWLDVGMDDGWNPTQTTLGFGSFQVGTYYCRRIIPVSM